MSYESTSVCMTLTNVLHRGLKVEALPTLSSNECSKQGETVNSYSVLFHFIMQFLPRKWQ